MRNNEKVSVLLLGNEAAAFKFLDNALSTVDIQHSILAVPDIETLFTFLDIAPVWRPQLLLLNANHKYCISHINAVRSFSKYDSVTIAVFDPTQRSTNNEELFAAGANICIARQSDLRQLEIVLKKVMTINWQYFRGSMNRETFFVSI
jgi:hypothetical protein